MTEKIKQVKALELIASLQIKPENQGQFKALAEAVFPPLALETGWQLTSLWEISDEASQPIKIQNQWLTNEASQSDIEQKLQHAFESLFNADEHYKQRLDALDALIDDERIYYANRYVI